MVYYNTSNINTTMSDEIKVKIDNFMSLSPAEKVRIALQCPTFDTVSAMTTAIKSSGLHFWNLWKYFDGDEWKSINDLRHPNNIR